MEPIQESLTLAQITADAFSALGVAGLTTTVHCKMSALHVKDGIFMFSLGILLVGIRKSPYVKLPLLNLPLLATL